MKDPKILMMSHEKLQTSYDVLMSFGFNKNEMKTVIFRCPPSLRFDFKSKIQMEKMAFLR